MKDRKIVKKILTHGMLLRALTRTLKKVQENPECFLNFKSVLKLLKAEYKDQGEQHVQKNETDLV